MSHNLVPNVLFLLFSLLLLFGALLLGRWMLIRSLGPDRGGKIFRQRVPLVITVMVAASVIGAGLSLPGLESMRDATIGLFAGLPLAYLPVHVYRKQRLGRVLVQLSWSVWNTLSLGIGCLFLVLGTTDAILEGGVRVLSLLWFSIGVAFTFCGLQRFQIREGGIVVLDSILPWAKITSYHWDSDGERPLLRFGTNRRVATFRVGYWWVPRQSKPAVEEALDRAARC